MGMHGLGNLKAQDGLVIEFGPRDLEGVLTPHNDALILWATVTNYEVAQIFIIFGSFINVLFMKALENMEMGVLDLQPMVIPLFGFCRYVVQTTVSLGVRSRSRR